MGPKKPKHKQKPQPKHQPPPASPGPPINVDRDNAELESAGYAEIKNECDKAFKQICKRNLPKALGILKKAISSCSGDQRLRPLSAAFVYCTRVVVLLLGAVTLDSEKEKKRNERAAVESAKKAAELSPNSVLYALNYAETVYMVAEEEEELYQEIIKECVRALEISNAVDPSKEAFFFETKILKTAEERIRMVKRDLVLLKLKAVISLITSWLKSTGVDCEVIKLDVDPTRRAIKDQIRTTRMSSEINKIKESIKTMEERRKEIVTKIAVARIEQVCKKAEVEMGYVKREGKEGNEKEIEAEVAMIMEELKTEIKKGNEKRGDEVINEMKIEAVVSMIMQELKKSKVEKGNEKGVERSKYGSETRNLEGIKRFKDFWNSMSIEMKKEGFLKIRVSDLQGYFESENKKALEVLNEALQFVEEKKSWRFWTCCNCGEKFVDEKSMKGHVRNHLWKLTPRLLMVLPASVEKEDTEKILNFSWKPVDVPSAVKLLGDCCKDSHCSMDHVVYPDDFWPVCEDSKRGPLLYKIHGLFKALIKCKCLAKFHIELTRQFALKQFENLASGSHLLKHNVHKTPVGICFLEAPKLQKVLDFLGTIFNTCKLDRYSDKSGVLDYGSIANQCDEVEEKIVLSDDTSWLYLDESLLPLDFAPNTTPSADANDDTLLLWILSGLSDTDPVQSWKLKKEEKARQGMEIFKAIDKLFCSIENLCEQKFEHMIDTMKAAAMEHLSGEGKKENGIEGDKGFLKRWMDEVRDMTTLEIIKSIFEDAEASFVKKLNDLESGDDDSRSEDFSHLSDTCVEGACERQIYLSTIKLCKLDAQILQNGADWYELECKYDPVSANDYRLILLPLVKSYLREAHLEDLAMEKSDAAGNALLAELELDSKRGVQSGNDNLRSSQEKAKDKKKTKEENRNEEIKSSIPDEHHLPSNVPREQASPLVTADDYHLDSDNLQSVNEDQLKLQEEDLRQENELEAEKTRLQEPLEYQRRIDNEDKVKHLDVRQHKKSEHEPLMKKRVFLNQPEEMHKESGEENRGLPIAGIIEACLSIKKRLMSQKCSTSSSEGKNQLPEKESIPVGIGMKNDAGENNCFLNVIIQSLRHLRSFQDEFLKRTEHVHVGAPCVVCALRDIFIELRTASTNVSREAVAPTSLRIALSNSPNSKNFKMGQMNDAVEVFLEILTSLHDSASTPGSSISDSESIRNKEMGAWNCTKVECIAHSLFGINKLGGMRCHQCGLVSRPLNTSFHYHIATSSIRTKKVMHAESSFDKILDIDKNEQSSCDHIDHNISKPPHVFTTVLEWEDKKERAEEIEATLEALSTEIDLSLIYNGTGSQYKHKLVSVVNYHPGLHYSCFIYSHEHEWWVRYDDEDVEVIGSWTDVLTMCKSICIKPRILFFEDVN